MPRSGTYSARPPDKDWQDIRLSDIARFEVAFPQIYNKKSEVTDEALPAVYRVVRTQLEVAAGILVDLGIDCGKPQPFTQRTTRKKTLLRTPMLTFSGFATYSTE